VTSKPAADANVEGVSAEDGGETDVPVIASGPPGQAVAPSAGEPAGRSAGLMASPLAQASAAVAAQNADAGGSVVMQGTGLKATSSSIFSAGGGMAASPVSSSGSSPASLFRSSAAPLPAALPDAATQQATPLPTTRLPRTNSDVGYPVEGAAAPLPAMTPAQAASLAGPSPAQEAGPSEPSLSLIGLFAATRKGRGAKASTAAKAGKALAPGMGPQQQAALSYAPLPGIGARSMFATVDDTAENHDDSSPAVEMASLSGLARLAPSGLLLQTETVETGCFKPQLLRILKSVEQHFGKKVLVTSGRRSLGHNIKVGGAPRSRHLTCEAADIQVAGVSKWEVAGFLRQAEGRGGVGTYCHTQSVHVDVGPRRDWNWQCAPRDV
jgi:uncharacterized protein YcbK (DUF882 family)